MKISLNFNELRYTLTLLISTFVFCFASQTAGAQTMPKVYGGYNKGGSSYDVVVKYSSKKKLQMFVNGQKSAQATVQRDSWATFKKVQLSGKGNVSFAETSTKSQALNYKSYFEVTGNKVRFYDSDVSLAQAHTNAIGTRTKTANCQITANREQDTACTPGAVFSNVTKDMVCKSGYSKSVRNVTDNTKTKVFAEYGIASHKSGAYEVDHLISLELGGTNDIANLWPEVATPTPGFHEKDKVENYLHGQVCTGKLALADAQNKITNEWLQVYIGLFPATTSQPKTTVTAPSTPPVQTATPAPAQSSGGVVKLSTTGICHAPGDAYYDRTIHYTAYSSMQACIDAGGRPSLR